jgi:succinyl-CoA synthetase beta subunit
LKLYEHEAKSILAARQIPTPKGELCSTSRQTREAAAKIGTPVAVKAQVLVAGRGKAGGILFADDPQEGEAAAKQLLGSEIKGMRVEQVLVEEKLSVKKELYLGFAVDRLNRCYAAVASDAGGVDIEETTEQNPEKIRKQLVDQQLGFRPFHARQVAKALGYGGNQLEQLAEIFLKLYEACLDQDAELAEINPLVETREGKFVAADARLIIDDNALFRHKEFLQRRLQEQRELSSEEFEALKNGLEYVKLNGDIGIVGNGAGLVMATLDLVSLCGGEPANFLDMGGGASTERILAALKIVLSNPQVKVILVNILGGITLCDEVARGIVAVRKQLGTSKPIAIRIVGTNEAEGKRILAEAGLPFFDSIEEAALMAVEFAERIP